MLARLVSVLGVLSIAPFTYSAETPKGFTPIFNGKNTSGWYGWAIHEKGASPEEFAKLLSEERTKKLDAWKADAEKHWIVESGELVNDGKGAYLATDRDYGDIELLLEYKTVVLADSGIYLRGNPQVQIWDTTKEGGKWDRSADKGSGGLFNNTKGEPGQLPLVHADKPFGEWNQMRIVQVGERTSVWLNGKLVVDHARMENYWGKQAKLNPLPPLPKVGKILLQTHGGEIRWRNMFLREIPVSEANEILRKQGRDGFASIFNGKDFTGWTGPLENYEVKDGGIACKQGKGGNIYTEGEFADFVARIEYKLPPGGNNGLALWYPGGKAHAATQGFCELQILDDTASKYDALDPRQFNGSAYGMIAARKGYLRPVGEWNFMEVTVKGSKLRVELNGTRILDGDLSTITEFKDKTPHPGKELKKGHFGFAGHTDPLEFRNIEIKKLP